MLNDRMMDMLKTNHDVLNNLGGGSPKGLIMLGFNDTSTLVGHFVSSPREREKRDRRDSRGDEREGQGRKNRNESKETEEIKTFPSILTCYKDSKPCPTVSQYQLDASVTLRYTTPSPHPTTPRSPKEHFCQVILKSVP